MNISLSLSLPRKNGLRLNFEYAAVSGLEEKQAQAIGQCRASQLLSQANRLQRLNERDYSSPYASDKLTH